MASSPSSATRKKRIVGSPPSDRKAKSWDAQRPKSMNMAALCGGGKGLSKEAGREKKAAEAERGAPTLKDLLGGTVSPMASGAGCLTFEIADDEAQDILGGKVGKVGSPIKNVFHPVSYDEPDEDTAEQEVVRRASVETGEGQMVVNGSFQPEEESYIEDSGSVINYGEMGYNESEEYDSYYFDEDYDLEPGEDSGMGYQVVASRGGGYGLDADIASRLAEKYEENLDAELMAQMWIEAVTDSYFDDLNMEFGPALKNGILLCKLANGIKPGIVPKINSSNKAYHQMENIRHFLQACRQLGVAEHSLFETVDLFELKDLGLVVRCIYQLGVAVQTTVPDFPGPHLGDKSEAATGPASCSNNKSPSLQAFPRTGSPALSATSPVNSSAPTPVKPLANDGGSSPTPTLPPSPPSLELPAAANTPPATLPQPPAALVVPAAAATKPAQSGTPQLPDKSEELLVSSPYSSPWPTEPAAPAAQPAAAEATAAAASEEKTPSCKSSHQAEEASGAGVRDEASEEPAAPQAMPEVKVTSPQGKAKAKRRPLSPLRKVPGGESSNSSNIMPQSQGSESTPKKDQPRSGTRGTFNTYGLDAHLAKKKEEKYDIGAEEAAQAWVEAVTGDPFGEGSFMMNLRDGQRLCKLLNTIKPGSVPKVSPSKLAFKQMENVSLFLRACRKLGVAEHSLFETVDLFEGKDLGLVVQCLHALGQVVQSTVPEFPGPHLGRKSKSAGAGPMPGAAVQPAQVRC
ncbi:unnamed protein product [Chrysoparadoxa australica]